MTSRVRLRGFAFSILGLLYTDTAVARDFRVTSWNMDWLSRRPMDDTHLPFDRPLRGPRAYQQYHRAFARLDADIFAFQEVDGPKALDGLLPHDRYQLIFSPAPIPQQVVIAVRSQLHVAVHPPLLALNVSLPGHNPLREGVDVTVFDDHVRLRILAVHLKTGCWEQQLSDRHHSCPLLLRQLNVISGWINERRREGTPFLIVGDFNRRFAETDPAFMLLRGKGTLQLATAGFASPCNGGSYFIDNLIIGGQNISFYPESLQVMVTAAGDGAEGLSDHCPVSATVTVKQVRP